MVPAPREIGVTLENGVTGTICVPHALDSENPFEKGFAPPTHKLALIVHGQGGHRDYCYQKLLAHKLAAELGIYSLRIDFRGCGDSVDNADPKEGRVLSQDIEDIQVSAEFITDASKNPLHIGFVLSSIIGHSRGSLAALIWAVQQDRLAKWGDVSKAFSVPNIVNCSSRFQSHTVWERYDVFNEHTQKLVQRSKRYGKLDDVIVTPQEITSLAEADLSGLSELSLDTSVLSIYGLEDHVVHIQDSSYFANALNRGPYSHHLELISGADHNFYGTVPIENEGDAEDYNPNDFPLNSRKYVNYNPHVASLIIDWLRPENELNRFIHSSSHIGHISRWKQVEGISNFRDMGGWKIQHPRLPQPNDPIKKHYYVRPGSLYRCSNTASITERGKRTLQQLKIKVMFDLRSDGECEKAGIPQGLEKYGIKRIHAPVFSNDDYSPQSIALRYSNLMTSWSTYVHVYEDMLEYGIGCFKTIFEFIRDDGSPMVFHCTAGKDRTGILGMLILLLLGVDKSTIAKEYELTTVGLKADHPKLKKDFLDNVEHMKSKFGDNADEIEEMLKQGRQDWTVEKDGFENLISSRYEAMLATIELFNNKYDGITGYMTKVLGFSHDDLRKIYSNLVVSSSDGSHGLEVNSNFEWAHKHTKAKF